MANQRKRMSLNQTTFPFETQVQWVNVHAISHTHRGKDSRGRFLRDRWTLHYTDKEGKTGGRDIYGEKLSMFDDCGLNFEWPNNARIELTMTIPVLFDSEYELVNVGQAYIPDTNDTAWRESALPRTRKRD